MGESNEQELVRKVGQLVRTRFAGSFKRAFDHYASKRKYDSSIDQGELLDLLADASIGNTLTRPAWATGIMRRVDRNRDGFIGYVEFEAFILHGPW